MCGRRGKHAVASFVRSNAFRVTTVFLVAQAAMLYSSMRPESTPPGRPLDEFPKTLGPWTMIRQNVVEPEVLDVLKADDIMNRDYALSNGLWANLFVAAFRTQRNGKTPHSPKNCLPGNGYQQVESSIIDIDTGAGAIIPVNRYIVSRGEERALSLYWYQSRDRAVASEYKAKYWVIMDAIRLNRTDTALVRVFVLLRDGDEDRATRRAVDFVRSFYPTLRTFLPS